MKQLAQGPTTRKQKGKTLTDEHLFLRTFFLKCIFLLNQAKGHVFLWVDNRKMQDIKPAESTKEVGLRLYHTQAQAGGVVVIWAQSHEA